MNLPPISLAHEHPSWFRALTKLLNLPPWISDTSLVTFLIVAMLAGLAWAGTRSLRSRGFTRGQSAWETLVYGLDSFVQSVMGPRGRDYLPFIGTLFIFILTMNLFGVLPGFISPTASLNTTVALALSVFCYVQFQGIQTNGLRQYLHHFWGDPWLLGFLMFPLHVIGELAKPLSLALRLAGNVFAEDSVLLILGLLSPFIVLHFAGQTWEVPWLPLQAVLAPLLLFFGVIQALVFSTLSAIYITLMLGEGHEAHGTH